MNSRYLYYILILTPHITGILINTMSTLGGHSNKTYLFRNLETIVFYMYFIVVSMWRAKSIRWDNSLASEFVHVSAYATTSCVFGLMFTLGFERVVMALGFNGYELQRTDYSEINQCISYMSVVLSILCSCDLGEEIGLSRIRIVLLPVLLTILSNLQYGLIALPGSLAFFIPPGVYYIKFNRTLPPLLFPVILSIVLRVMELMM